MRRERRFNNESTFPIYIGRLVKACRLLDLPIGWKDGVSDAAVRGLKPAQDWGDIFGNFVIRDIFRNC